MNIKDFEPGQTVYVLSRERSQKITERAVKSVGKKYVTLLVNWDEQYYVRNDTERFLVEKVDVGYPKYLFATKEELELHIERAKLATKIKRDILNVVDKMEIEQLRQIAEWMDEA